MDLFTLHLFHYAQEVSTPNLSNIRLRKSLFSNPEELEFKVTSITQLSDVRDAVCEVKLYIPTDIISREFVDEMAEMAKNSKGKSQLKFTIQDVGEDIYLTTHSRKYRISLTQDLTQFIEKYHLKYSITVNQ